MGYLNTRNESSIQKRGEAAATVSILALYRALFTQEPTSFQTLGVPSPYYRQYPFERIQCLFFHIMTNNSLFFTMVYALIFHGILQWFLDYASSMFSTMFLQCFLLWYLNIIFSPFPLCFSLDNFIVFIRFHRILLLNHFIVIFHCFVSVSRWITPSGP